MSEIGLALIDLQPAARIRAAVVQDFVAQPIGEARGKALRARILARGAQAAHQSRLRAGRPETREESGDVVRIVLAVTVHGGRLRGQAALPT